MSNIIRSYPYETGAKKILRTQQIVHVQKEMAEEQAVSATPEELRRSLQEEIHALHKEREELQVSIEEQKIQAETELAAWQEQMKQQAEATAALAAEQAEQEGRRTGYEDGVRQAEQESSAARDEIQALIEGAYAEKEGIIKQAEPFLLELSVRIAGKILNEKLEQDDERIIAIVKQALKQVEKAEDVVLHVPVAHYPIILPFAEELQTYIPSDEKLKIIPVSAMEGGGCVIHTANGSYDAAIDNQLEEIKKHLLNYCEETAAHEVEVG